MFSIFYLNINIFNVKIFDYYYNMKKISNLLFMLILVLISIFIGFSGWYIIFSFLLNEKDLFTWHWIWKILYLLFSGSASDAILERINKES